MYISNLSIFRNSLMFWKKLDLKKCTTSFCNPVYTFPFFIVCKWAKEKKKHIVRVYDIFYRLLSKLPNSYAFTKALGEALAVEAMEHIPLIILRPSIGKSHYFVI